MSTASPAPTVALTVTISGATGLIGSALAARLRSHGHSVRRLVRSSRNIQSGDVPWDPARGLLDARALAGSHAIVNLAGASIAQRWTRAHKVEMRESRLRSTELIVRSVAALDQKPRVVLSGSAVGYYGDRGDELVDERSSAGTDFLATLARDWEDAARPVTESGVRLVLLRTGIVLAPDGGALKELLRPFRLGLGGPVGSGRQWMSWISLTDHVAAMEHALVHEALTGPVNLVAPNPVTNSEFASTLGHVLHRPAAFRVPAFLLEAMLGEMADGALLASQRAAPSMLLQSGFTFGEARLEQALRSLSS